MDNKRVKLTTTNIEAIEQQTSDRLLGTENCYAVPDEFRGHRPTTWNNLQQNFPLPKQLQTYTRRVTLGRSRYNCFCLQAIVVSASNVLHTRRKMLPTFTG